MSHSVALPLLLVAAAGLSGCSAATTGPPAAAPVLNISSSPIVFPNILAGTVSAPVTVQVGNTGNAPLSFSGVTLTGTGAAAFAIASNTCGTMLAATSTCSISLIFSPVAVASYSAALTITDNAAGSPQTLTVSGQGTGSPTVAATATVNFNSNLIGSTATLPAVISNTSNVPVTVSSVTLGGSGAAAFSIGTNPCVGLIAAGASCTVNVTFSPTVATASSAVLSIVDNAAGSPQTSTLNGTGAAEPNSCKAVNVTSPAQPVATANYAGTAFSGTVMAGTLPVIGARVQIYAAGRAGNGSAPVALLAAPLVTNAVGTFQVPASFICPYSNSVLYAVASGGQAGSSGAANAGIMLAGVLGVCNAISSTASFTLNEVTTAAMAWSMQQFLAPGGKMGASATNSSGIALAAGTFANLANILTGTTPGAAFPSNGVAPSGKIAQVANLLNACIVSSGATSSACSQLYTLTATSAGTPANTLDAVLNLVRNPGTNVAALYALSGASTAFSPALTAAPSDWMLFATFAGAGMNNPSSLSIDSTGRVWVTNYGAVGSLFTNTGAAVFANGITGNNLANSYGGGVDVNDVEWFINEEGGLNNGFGSVVLLNNGGGTSGTYTAGGINFPLGVSFDTSGVSWIVDYGDSTMTLLTNSGTPLSGTSGFSSTQYDFPVAVATDANCNGWVANQSSNDVTFTAANGAIYGEFAVGNGPSGIAVDSGGNVWAANYYGSSVGLITAAHAVASPSGGFTGGGLNHPQGIAPDGAGNIWLANFRAMGISELTGASATTPGAAISPATGWAPDAGLLGAFALAIDGSGNVWVSNFFSNTITEFVGAAVPVKTPLLGPVRVP